MQQAFIIDRVSLYSPSVKKQIYNPDKILLADSGIYKAFGFSVGENFGSLLENIFGNYLLQKYGNTVFYWKNGTEIDYLRLDGHKIILDNVTVSTDEETTFKREISSLETAAEKFQNTEQYLRTAVNTLGREDSRIVDLIQELSL